MDSGDSDRGLTSLPKELLTDTTRRVAGESIEDAFRVASTCKDFRFLVHEPSVLAHACLPRGDSWDPSRFRVEQLMRQLGNKNVLYRDGLHNLFNREGSREQGLRQLHEAWKDGCVEAGYLLGLMALCEMPSRVDEGVQLLDAVKARGALRRSRVRVVNLLSPWKFHNGVEARYVEGCNHPTPPTINFRRRDESSWSFDPCDWVQSAECQICNINLEIEFFCDRILRFQVCRSWMEGAWHMQ